MFSPSMLGGPTFMLGAGPLQIRHVPKDVERPSLASSLAYRIFMMPWIYFEMLPIVDTALHWTGLFIYSIYVALVLTIYLTQ